jgi:glycine/D-amino acid oxidase-like deaminating enzyme
MHVGSQVSPFLRDRALDPVLAQDIDVDVAIVGAGPTGLTTAHLLLNYGFEVAVLERREVGAGITADGALSVWRDCRYRELILRAGLVRARGAIAAAAEAIGLIEEIASAIELPEGAFERIASYHYLEHPRHAAQLSRELEAAHTIGLPVVHLPEAPLPFGTCAALRVDRQAQIDPFTYMDTLAASVRRRGAHLFAGTTVTAVDDGDTCRVRCGSHTVRARAALVPAHGALGPFERRRSCGLAARTDEPPRPGLFADSDEGVHLRWHRGLFVAGGPDPITLDRYVAQHLALRRVVGRWERMRYHGPRDLPYIGRVPGTRGLFIGAALGDQPLVWATVAAAIVSELIAGHHARFREVFA